MFIVLLSCEYCCYLLCIVAGLLARSQYLEGPEAGHLGTGFSLFPCVYKQMLRWFPRLQVTTACFSCSPPNLNFLVTYIKFLATYFVSMYTHNNHCHRVAAQYYYYYNSFRLSRCRFLHRVGKYCKEDRENVFNGELRT
jgi:hypothetical protein